MTPYEDGAGRVGGCRDGAARGTEGGGLTTGGVSVWVPVSEIGAVRGVSVWILAPAKMGGGSVCVPISVDKGGGCRRSGSVVCG
jgi:hypothetical protein